MVQTIFNCLSEYFSIKFAVTKSKRRQKNNIMFTNTTIIIINAISILFLGMILGATLNSLLSRKSIFIRRAT
jgi:hypothetical protein